MAPHGVRHLFGIQPVPRNRQGLWAVAHLHPPALLQDLLAGRLIRARQRLLQGDCGRAEAERLQHLPDVEPPGARHDGELVEMPDIPRHLVQSSCLRPTHCRQAAAQGVSARGHRAADENPVCPGFDQPLRLPTGARGPSQDVDVRVVGLAVRDQLAGLLTHLVGAIDEDEVGSGTDERGDALFAVLATHDHRGSHHKLAGRSACHHRVLHDLPGVAAGQQRDQVAPLVDDGELAHLRRLQGQRRLVEGDRLRAMDHLRSESHDVVQLPIAVLLRVRLTLADPTDELAADLPILGDGHAADAVRLPEAVEVRERGVRGEGDGIQNEAADVPLHPTDHIGLRRHALVAMDDADAADQSE
mmetsp:Transcript_6070/g.17290  ORF Transcript_6070/g.17290 Transcript_6070/m.17290 type:complete len:358 (+) Transcript_6070:352-1425(+)